MLTPTCPLPKLRLVHPFIRHSAVLRRAGRSQADCTRGLGEVTTPCCLLASCLLDEATVHLQGKWLSCVRQFIFWWIAACFSCRNLAENIYIYKETERIRHEGILQPSFSFFSESSSCKVEILGYFSIVQVFCCE